MTLSMTKLLLSKGFAMLNKLIYWKILEDCVKRFYKL